MPFLAGSPKDVLKDVARKRMIFQAVTNILEERLLILDSDARDFGAVRLRQRGGRSLPS
jgi:hypothetical protein